MGATSTGGGFISSSSQIADNVIVAADILDESITLAKLTPTGTATHVLTSNGEGANPEYKVIPSGTGANYAFIETLTLGADAKILTSASITASTYIGFVIIYKIKNVAATNSGFGLLVNEDDGSSYSQQAIYGSASTISTSARNLTYYDLATNNNPAANYEQQGIIFASNLASGFRGINHQSSLMNSSGAISVSSTGNGVWKSTNEINKFSLRSTTANMLTGTTFSIWGMKNA